MGKVRPDRDHLERVGQSLQFDQNALVMMKKNEEICWGIIEKYGVKEKTKDEDIKKSSHLAELCEACEEGVCIRFYEEKEVKEEDVKKEAKKYVRK